MTKKKLIGFICLPIVFLSWNLASLYQTIPLTDFKFAKIFDVKTNGNVLFKNIIEGDLNVIVFHSLDCPFNKTYDNKLNELIERNDSVNFIFVNSNPSEIEEDFSKDELSSFDFSQRNKHYILDKTKSIRRIFGVKKNGTCIIFKSSNNKSSIKLFYQGPVDNSPQSNILGNSKGYLDKAILDALNGKETLYKGFQTGCRILNH